MQVSISRVVVSIGVVLSALAIGSVAFGLKGANAPEVAPEPSVQVMRPITLPDRVDVATALEEVKDQLPDLAGVDWTALAFLMEEERRITRQMEVDEARMQYGKCGEWKMLAEQIGWPAAEWYTMSHVLYRESRCSPISHYKGDPMSGSRGLMQINGYWCKPSKWSKAGWLQDRGILTTCDDLFDPEVNLRAGLAIWMYGEEKHGCGWRGPWATPCDKYTSIQKQP